MKDKEQLQQAIHDLELAIKNAYPLAGLSVAYNDIGYRLHKAEKVVEYQGEMILQLQEYLDKVDVKRVDIPLEDKMKKYCHKMSCGVEVSDDLFCDMHREQAPEEREPFDSVYKTNTFQNYLNLCISIPNEITDTLGIEVNDTLQIEITEDGEDDSLGFVVFKEKK